jgi:site-specific DNA-methyltransferase (adenine-specific)
MNLFYSSATDEWATPPAFFAQLNRRYRFTLDPCATAENAKCELYFTKEQDGLKRDWGEHRVFCNPPYGRAISAWARKCFEASQQGALVVLLCAVRTDTRWFRDYVYRKARIEFCKGRFQFGDAKNGAPFASMLAVYLPRQLLTTCSACGYEFIARSDAKTCSNACRQTSYRKRQALHLGRNNIAV